MERTGLSDLLSNETTGQGEFPGNGLARLLDEPVKPKAQEPAEEATGGAPGKGNSVSMPPSASVAEFVKNAMPAAQRVAKRLNVPVEAVIGQWGLETGWGKSVIPGTNNLGNIKDLRGGGVSAKDNANGKVDKYRQYGSVDEFAEDFANLLGNTNYKAVPGAKDAQAYFAALKAARYAEDPDYVAKGTSAARMVAEAMGKSGQGSTPDLSKAPKWSDITGKPEFKALSDAEKAEAKKAYFDYWVAPHAGDQADALREQFMAKSDEPGWGQRLSEGLDDLNKRAADAIKGVFTKEPSALERPNADVPKNDAASMAPVRPEVRAQFNAIWDSATPQQREAMAQQPGWRGMLARERAGIYSQPGAQLTQTGQQFDPRVESRREALIAKGEDARAADTFARMGARQGIQPGLEVAKLGGVQASEFDFDTKQAFGGDQANGLNNVLARGLTKGGLGIGKAITGYGEFLSDVYGLDETGKTMREGSKWARGKEEAIGQRGTFLERNLEGAISSIAQQLPLLVAGVGAASQAIPLAGMAMQSFGQEYSDGKARGLDTAQAGTRAAAFAAFEVIGERFGLRAQMDALKGAARGMPTSEIFKFMAESLKKEIPGELLTTNGQFAVDKWAPAGMALNPNATMEDYLKQVADTIAQTIMQGGIMTGGTTGVSSAVRYAQDKGPTAGQIEAGAITARDRALGAWETNGLSPSAQPGAQASPRAEPAMAPHQTVQDADQIVRELAEQAGVPLETVLPESVLSPQPAPIQQVQADPAQQQTQPAEPAPAATQEQGQFSDNDVLAFAEARYRTLRDKAEGGVSLVPGDEGMVEQEIPGVPLNEAEQRELDALAQAGKNPAALRAMYGFDNQRTEVADAAPAESEADREARLEREAIQAEGPASSEVQTDDDIPGFGDVQTNGIAPRDEKNGKAQGGSKAVFDEVDKVGRVDSDAMLAEISAKQKAGEKVDWKYYQKKQYNAIQAAITDRAQDVAAAIVANADQNGIATLRRAMKRGDELLLANVVDMVNTPNAGAIMTNQAVKAAVLDILRKQYPNDAPAQAAGTATEGAAEKTKNDARDLAKQWDMANRMDRNEEWQSGAATSVAAFNAAGQAGANVPAHGMAKAPTLTDAIKSLMAMLDGGIDQSRTLYTDALTNPTGASTGATAGGHAYRDGPFIITFREGLNGRQPTSADITGVLVNPAHPELVAPLQQAYPGLVIRDYTGVADVVEASRANPEQTASQPAQEQPKTRAGSGHFKSASQYVVDTEDAGSFDVRVNRLNDGGVLIVPTDGSQIIEHNAAFSEGKTDEELLRYSFEPLGVNGLRKKEGAQPKPKTEKEARAQKDYSEKWFGTAEKAQAFIAKQGIGESHEVAQDGKKFIIKKKGTSNGTQAPETQQAGAQQQEAGDQGNAAQAGAGTQGPGVPATGRTDVQADGLNESGLVVIPADAQAFADMLADEIESADGDERVEALFRPGMPKVVMPKTVEGGRAPKAMPFMSAEDAAAEVEAWKAEAKRQGKEKASANAGRTVISLFDASGVMAQPWIDAGYNVVTYDLQNGQDINDFSAEMLIDEHGNDNVWAVIAQPPCTDFASSGAQWWKEKDADGRTEASNELVRQALRTVELLRPAVWVMENPVGRIAEQNNLPDPLLSFDPWHFGDPWTKRTMYWGRFNNQLPTAAVAPTEGSKVHKLSGSNKYERSLTPEGVAYATFMANNAEGMTPSQRMAFQFPGVERALFADALDAGKSESDIRTEIEDAYNDGDLETVRETLEDMAGEKQAAPAAPAAADDIDAMFDEVLAEELDKDEAKKPAKPASTLPKAGTILFDQYGTDYRFEAKSDEWMRLTKNPHKLSEQAIQMDASSFNRLVQEDAQFRADIIEQNTKPKTEKEAKAKRAEAAVREMTEDGRAKDGKPINGGDVFRTLSGRTTTPYPKQKGERYASDWLIENAKAEAQARGDDFNTTGFGAVTKLKGGNLTEADKAGMLMYLFGWQPDVVPSILKPLASAGKNSAAALANAIDGLGALFGGAGKLSSGFTFDEDTYAKAKPLFKEAVANLGEAGKDLREAMRAVVRLVLDKFGAQAAQNMKPYVVRFIEESSSTKGKDEETTTPATVQAEAIYTPEGKFKVAQQLADHLIGGGTFDTIVAARKMIGDIIGRKIDPATELAKQADETVEVAVVLAAREMIAAGRKQGRTPQVIYDRLLSLFKAQPNLAVRSSTSMRDQAYSTPVPLAYVASELAGVTADTKMIESTAGNGMLAIGASLANATVNELNPKRAAMLEAMGFKPTTENAATATLAPARSQDAVVINPPFGATKDSQGNTIVYEVKPNFGTREVDHAIVFKTLEAMKDDGRAVLIVGGVMSEADEARREDYRGKNKRTFYFNLYNDYNVVDHFTVDGSLYAKQGASYPVDVIVIQGRGKSSRDLPAAALPHIIRSYEELKEKLNAESSLGARGADGADVADSGIGGAGNPDDTQGVAGRPGASGGRVGAQGEKPSAGGAAGVRGAGSGRVNGQPQPGGAVPPAEQLEPQGVAGGVGDRQGAVRGEGAGKRGSTGSTGNERLPALGGPGIVSGERVQSGLTDRRGEEQETETQVAYTPQSGATSVGTLVPRAMKDAIEGSLQRIADEVGDLDQYVADSLAMDPETLRENFSAEQVDALALAIRNAEAGKGFIIGDQTGIGKGRVVAAMIRYALINDKTPVFVTEKPNLYSDMIRDLDDIGMTDDLGLDTENPRIFITNSDETIPYTLLRTEGDEVVENNLTLRPAKRGAALNDLMKSMMEGESLGDYKVIFTTYSQLQTVKGAETTRQKFVQQFGAGNYMIFDESHNAGGAGETQARTKEQRKAEKAGQSLVTGRAAFVRSLVTSAYGTFFSSATYAKRPDVMDLYSSTNMRLAVDKIADLGAAIKAGGVPMQQVVANMLTQDGQYIRRERTFAGVSYDTVPTSVDKQTAENMASAMRSILAFSRRKDALLAQMQKEADKEGAMLQAVGGAKTSIEGANFGAIMHNLIDQMLLALKVESSVKHAIARLKAGEKVVMTVSNTMGSFLKEYADEMGLNTGDVVGLSFGDLYQRYLEKQRIIKIKRPNGQPPEEKRLSDAELGPELTQMFNEIQTQIRNAGFGSAPISPIDYMHTELRKAGFATDEITGRTMVLNYVDGTPTLASRTANIKQRVNAVRGFNNGTVDVLILNQAGSTGLSLHAASKFKDQRKRHMIIVQAEKNIDTHMQMLGRVHRTGQVVTPAYSQMMADIPAEMRPAAVLLKKMASLNANTTASRKSAVTAEGVVDFMNDYGGQVVHEFLRDNPDVHSALGGGKVLKLLDEVEEATEDDIRKLTGYIPILPIAEQERIYADLIQRYNELIERENSLGTNKLEAKALDLDAETIKVQPLTEQKQDPSIFAAPANMELVDVKRTVKPFSSEEVKTAVKERLGGQTNGAAIAAEMVKSLRERGQAFIDERMKKAEASDKADPVRLADQRMLLQMTLNRVATVLETFRIGQQVSVADKNTGVLYGVITDIAPGGRTANPAAGSDWKMTIALANGDAKSITINFSQIGNRYQIKGESTVNWYNAETQQGEEMRVIDIFDKGVRVRREKRWIVTGNILAGFSKFQGQIITYTKKDGTVGQGVLMSRQFDFDKEIRGMKVGMRNVAAAMEFFKTAGMNSTIGTEDGNFKIMATRSQFSAMTPSAKRIGGSYYLDPDLTEAIGADFYKKGTNMVATVPDYRIAEVLDYLINTRGETLVALTHNDVARKLAGLDGAAPGGNTKSEGVKFNTQDSADGYTWGHEKQQTAKSTPQKTERSAKNIRQLHSGVVDYLRGNGQTVDDRVQPYIAVDVPAAQEIREIAKAFGIEVQWFDLAEGLTPEQKRQFGGFNGANYKGVQYLRANGVDRPHLAILGHEVAHQLRRDAPDLYDEFVDAVNRYIKPGEYKKFLTLPVARGAKDPREEFSAEVLSDVFMERDFWATLGEQNPSLLQRLADMVVALVDKLMQTVGYTKKSGPYLTDYRKVVEIATDVMVRYKGRKVDAGQGISFNAQDDKGSVPNIVRKVQNNLIQFFGSQSGRQLDTFNAYDKTIGSQYNKALKDKHFGRVYQLLLGMQNHVSMAAMRAAQLAPGVLPQVDDIKGAAKALFSKRKQGSLDSATRAIFMGTLAGENVMQGQVWTKGEFMGRFGNDETAWALYEQTRAAIDASLDEVAAAEAYSLAQKFLTKDMRAKVIAEPGGAEALILNHLEQQLNMARMAIVQAETTGDEQQANEMAAMRDAFKSTIRHVEAIFTTAKNLKAAGYAPLMRFGKYTVEAKFIDPMTGNVERDENGQPMTAFFGRFESEKEARKAEARLRVEFDGRDDVAITAGTYNSDRHELYTGVTPETLELFAEATGMGNMADEFIRLAKSDRSAMKRQLERKGTPGFSQDLPRVLSSFITSNARHAAQRLYMTSINQAVKRIPKEKGDVQQEAQKLRNFVLNPDDAGAISSSLMFAWFLGGSVAAAAVNLTQPLMVTLPYLAQFTSMAKASALLTKAMPAAFGKAEIRDKDLREGLERASLEGVVDAQEIFHLYSLGSHQLIKGNRGQAALTLWGSLFSGVEKINRRMTFIAAWNLAKENGEANPYAFAVRAVNQTQGIYNKVNRPNVSRTWAGRMVMTYKGYALMVGELMVRMWKAGPGGKKAVAIMLAMLFLAAGEEGLPMAKALDDLIDTIGQLLGFDTNMRRWKRRTAHEILGQAWGDVFLYGASAVMPLDFGSRLGLGQMIPGTEILKPSSGIFNMRAIGEIIGPTAGAGGQIGDAAEASFEGNYGKAVQNASPKAVRDVLAAMEMATRGQATDVRGRKVTDVGLGDAAVKAVGFQPTTVAQEHRKTMPIQQDIALQRKREAAIVAKWARAAMDGDQKGVQEAIAERDAWNARNPDTPIVISKQQIMGRVKTMRADKDTRTFKTAPKEMRGRIGLDMLDD